MQVNTTSKTEKIASKDATRNAINQLNVVSNHPVIKGPALEATDGRRYVAIPIELDPRDRPGMVPRTIVSDIARIKRACKLFPGVAVIKKRWLRFADKSLKPRRLEKDIGIYPVTKAYMPRVNGDKPEAVFVIGLNAKYLAEIAAAFGMRDNNVLLKFYGDCTSIEVTPVEHPDGKEGYAVLMPLRNIGKDKE